MIVCVAGNPSIDKLFEVERVTPGEIHRPLAFFQVPGGKGLNVVRAATALGADVTAVAILGGHAGRWVAEALEAEGVRARFAWTAAETRASLSVADRETGGLTEFYEDGSEIGPDAWAQLERLIGELFDAGARWLTMSGSLPPGAPADGYARLVAEARRRDARCALDAQGGALRLAIAEGPTAVKVNDVEAGDLLGFHIASAEESAGAARAIAEMAGGQGHAAIITRGAEGATLIGPDGSTWSGALYERGPYPVGSGDSFLAGLVTALDADAGWPEALALALGAGTANAEIPGAGRLDPTRARELAGAAIVRRR